MGKVRLADGEAARTACARVLVRGGADERTGEHLTPAAVAERAGWCAALVKRAALTIAITGTWPAQPGKRTAEEWDQVRAAIPGGDRMPSDRDTGAMSVRAIDDALEPRAVVTSRTTGRDRSKAGPTRKQPSRPAPRQRGAPSPSRPPGRDGQRPEGHATTDRPLPRAARRDQGATTTSSTPVTRPHRARGAALGAGFHLNAHATPPRWEPIPSTPGLTEDH